MEELSPELNWMEKTEHKFEERISTAWISDSQIYSSYHAYKEENWCKMIQIYVPSQDLPITDTCHGD